MYFPAICVDSFFNDPYSVREFALNQEYFSCKELGGTWPGTRTKQLHEIAPSLYNDFTTKFFSLFYHPNETFDFYMDASFQKISSNVYGDIQQGWIHKDENCKLAGIVYLNPHSRVESGTSLYVKTDPEYIETSQDIKQEMYTRFDPDRYMIYQTYLNEHNKKYFEVARFNNCYNRLVAYDGSNYHGVTEFKADISEPRLTLVFFVRSMKAERYPIPSIRSIHT